MLATVVDLAALWKILVVVLVVGVGITALFGEGVVSVNRLLSARRSDRPGATVLNGVIVALTAVVCAAALVAGFVAMTHK